MDTFNLPRPRWTQKLREDARRERHELGFNPTGPIKVIDVNLALKILESQQRWRSYLFEIFLTAALLAILLAYALWARAIPNGYFVAQGVIQAVNHDFRIEETTFDLNTVLNTSAEFGLFNNGEILTEVANLDPTTLQPIQVEENLKYERCFPGGQVAPSSAPTESTGTCLKVSDTRKFETIRSSAEFAKWLNVTLNRTILFRQDPHQLGISVVLLGAIRIRQLKSRVPFGLVKNEQDERTNQIECQGPNLGSVPPSARVHRKAKELNSFPSPTQPSNTLIGETGPHLSERLDFYFPSDGYVFDLRRCDPAKMQEEWLALQSDCAWINNNDTSAVFVSFTGYDPVSDSFVFAQLSFERYPQGTQLTSMDVRVFRVPGSSSDEAYIWRIVLCAFSLAQLVFFISRMVYRAVKLQSVRQSVDRWFFLDVISVAFIQAAVWLSISNSQNSVVQAVSTPEAMGALSKCDYPSYVSIFDSISYDEKVEDLLLGISLILQGLKFFQICQLSARLSAAYSIVNTVGRQILWWLILTSSFFFFFAFGAHFLFGLVLAQFYTLPASLVSTFLIFSKIPKYSINFFDTSDWFGPEFWLNFEHPNLAAYMWELAEFSGAYDINALFGFAFWLGAVIVFVYWIMRNLLLGVVLSGYEIVKRDIEAEEMDALERSTMRKSKIRTKVKNVSLLKQLAYFMKQVIWRVWNHRKLDRLLLILRSDPSIRRRGFATEHDMENIFKSTGIIKKDRSRRPTSDLTDSGDIFEADFYASFEFTLEAVDEAILILSQQEHPLALSLPAVSEIRKAPSFEQAVKVLLEKCVAEFSNYHSLPFVRQLTAQQSNPDAKTRLVSMAMTLAKSMSSPSSWDNDGHFDAQKLARRLALRVSDDVEQAVARLMEKALSNSSAYSGPHAIICDDAVDLVYDACQKELGICLDCVCVEDKDQIRLLIWRELRKSKRADPLGRYCDLVAFKLDEIFPNLLAGWKARPTDQEVERCRIMFQEKMDADNMADQVASSSSRGNSFGEGDLIGEYEEEAADDVTKKMSIGGEGQEEEDADRYSISTMEGGGDVDQLAIARTAMEMEDNFDPTAQQRWEAAVYSGNFVLSLSIMHALRSAKFADQLTRELISLEREQQDLEKELLTTRQSLDDRISARKPMATAMREIRKHGIEPHPAEKTYHVHYIHPRTKEYRFVGVFLTQEEAESAMTEMIEMENVSFEGTPNGQSRDHGALETNNYKDSWINDDKNYAAQAKEKRQKKRIERAKRYQGHLNPYEEEEDDDDENEKEAGEDKEEDDVAEEDKDEDDEDDMEKDVQQQAVNVGESRKSESIAKRIAVAGQAAYGRIAGGFIQTWDRFQHWLNRNHENRLHLDLANNVWRDVNDEPVRVIDKPKTVQPLAGKRWQKLQSDNDS